MEVGHDNMLCIYSRSIKMYKINKQYKPVSRMHWLQMTWGKYYKRKALVLGDVL